MAAARTFGLSFSGSGHLLAYHLGVARTLLLDKGTARFDAHFCGASGGAVAATIAAVMPHRIEEFLEEYALACKALTGIRDMLGQDAHTKANAAGLRIQLTDTASGAGVQLARFDNREQLIDAVFASCRFPRSFHPFDLLSRGPRTYPAEEGKRLLVEGMVGSYADGALSDPLPMPAGATHATVTVSPWSGPPSRLHICPTDASLRLGTAALGAAGRGAYRSVENARRMVVGGAGAAPPQLLRLFEQGGADAITFLRDG